MAAIRRVVDGSHPPWSLRPHCCKRDLGRGLSSAGYKLMRRVLHSAKGLRLGSNAHGKPASTGITPRNAPRFGEVTDTTIVARRALSPSTPHACGVTLRASGVDRSRGQAEELPCRSMQSNAPVSHIEREEVENDETAKNLLTGVGSYKRGSGVTPMERGDPAVCNVSFNREGKDE